MLPPQMGMMMGGGMMNNNNNGNNVMMMELPSGGCAENCKSCFCPCYVFGKLVNRMHGNRNAVDVMACGSWAACLLMLWGGTATGVQILAANGGAATYGSYALYSCMYLEYLYPYLQALYMYKTLKGLYSVAGGNEPQLGQQPVEVDVPCRQWCTFCICPCCYLGSADAYVNLINGPYGSGAVQLRLTQQNLCPLRCYSDYNVEVRQGINGMNITNNGGVMTDPNNLGMVNGMDPTQTMMGMPQQTMMGMPQMGMMPQQQTMMGMQGMPQMGMMPQQMGMMQGMGGYGGGGYQRMF